MRVLLTGATGFIGRYILEHLTKHQTETVVVGRTQPVGYGGDFIFADLLNVNDYSAVVQAAQATHLLHLAWYAEHGKYWTSPLNLRWVEASMRLAEAFCDNGGKKIVMAGTCAEYDWSFGDCREDETPLFPSSLYGVAKDATRRLCSAICEMQKVDFSWGRIFFPYGQGEDQRRLIPSLVGVFRDNKPAFGVNTSAYRDFLHAEDVADGFIKLLMTEATGNYNISAGQPTRIGDIVKLIAEALNADPSLILNRSTDRPGEPEKLIGDNRKLKALGWYPRHVIADDISVESRKKP